LPVRSAVLELHGEALLVGFDGDGALDGIQEFKARSKAWSSVSEAPCKRVEERLEVRSRPCYAEHGERMMRIRRPGKWRCYQEVQEVEAKLVARLWRMMRSMAARIVRRSSSYGRVASVMVILLKPASNQGPILVSNMRGDKRRRTTLVRKRGKARPHRNHCW
jgi:hypothetical protein